MIKLQAEMKSRWYFKNSTISQSSRIIVVGEKTEVLQIGIGETSIKNNKVWGNLTRSEQHIRKLWGEFKKNNIRIIKDPKEQRAKFNNNKKNS